MNLNWQKEQQKISYSGEEREGYTLTYIEHLHSLLLFGGGWTPRDNDLYLYDLMSREWKMQKVSTSKPTARKYHTAHYHRDIRALIVYGGEADKRRSLDSFEVLYVDDWKWKKLLPKNNIPPAREFHTFTPISNGDFLIFGGLTLPYSHYLNDLWVLKGLDQLKDTKTVELYGGNCVQVKTKGTPPSGRYAHKAHYHKQTLYIIGGECQAVEQSFTIFSLDLGKLVWFKHTFNINLSQLINPNILANPSSRDEIFVFGGLRLEQNSKTGQKQNRYIYTLNLQDQIPKIRKNKQLPDNIQFDLSCCLPFNQVIGMCCSMSANKLTLYRIEYSQQEQQLQLQQYLRYIKNQQFLSQELLHKVTTLEQLYKQIQSYTSRLYKQYQDSGDYDEEIQAEKKVQIQACLGLKDKYGEIQELFGKNLVQLKKARRELAGLNQYFEGYIETERDQDQ